MRGDEMSKPNFFEDIEVGSVEEFGRYEVSAQEIIEFATKYDPQPFHLSEEGGNQTHFGGLVASGWHTGSIAMRLICDNMPEQSASLGSPGIDELRWRKPVFPGDVLRVRSTITDKRASRSRPEMGSVFILNEVINQNDVVVMSYSPIVLYKRRT